MVASLLPSRVLPAGLLLAFASTAMAGGSWLGLSPEVAQDQIQQWLGLRAVQGQAIPYVHPFSPENRDQLETHHQKELVSGQAYYLLGPPGPRDRQANQSVSRTQHRVLTRAGFRVLYPYFGGLPHAPFCTLARFQGDPRPTPTLTDAVPVEKAMVRLSLLHLPREGSPREVSLLESLPLVPEAAFHRAEAVRAQAGKRWVRGRHLSLEAVQESFPKALEALGDVDVRDLGLALRVLWNPRKSDAWISGPGGVLLSKASGSEIALRLVQLYEKPAKVSPPTDSR